MTLWTTGPRLKFLADDILKYFSQETRFGISYKFSSGDNLDEMTNPGFFGKISKNIISLLSFEFTQSGIKIKEELLKISEQNEFRYCAFFFSTGS